MKFQGFLGFWSVTVSDSIVNHVPPPPVLSSSTKQKQVASAAAGRVCVSHSLRGVSWRATDVFFPIHTQALLIMLLLAQISSGAPSRCVGRKRAQGL